MQNRIAELRKKLRWSAAKLGQEIGVSRQMMRRLEKGERNLTHEYMARIAEKLGCKPADIIAPDSAADVLPRILETLERIEQKIDSGRPFTLRLPGEPARRSTDFIANAGDRDGANN